jgi:hypothetical protein
VTATIAFVAAGLLLLGLLGLSRGLAKMHVAIAATLPDDPRDTASPEAVAVTASCDLPEVVAIYFGEPWDCPAVDGATQVPTPDGQLCDLCGEPICPGDRGWLRGAIRGDGGRMFVSTVAHHAECELLTVVGHTWGVCSCTGFDTTSRASALELWRRIHQDEKSKSQ